VPVPGIRTDLRVPDAVIDKALSLKGDRNLALPVPAAMWRALYQVETRSSALDRGKADEAPAVPSIGQLIPQLNQKN